MLNKTKIVAIHFASNNQCKNGISLKIDDTEVPLVDYTKFLGVWIDHKFNWKMHAGKLIRKLYGRIALLKKSKHFLKAHVLRILYQAYIFSHLRYPERK